MQHFTNHSLSTYNTFGLPAKAQNLWLVANEDDLLALHAKGIFAQKHLILGGGSNILLTRDFDGHVVVLQNSGKRIIGQDENEVEVQFAAGERWHTCVMWALQHNFGGIENLALIPGTAGAAPMQNIGAYGVEVKDSFKQLRAFHKASGEFRTFSHSQCAFGYRESVFKNELKDAYIIWEVNFALSTQNHKLHLAYGAINTVLQQKGITAPNIQQVAEAVIEIRQSKLPDPAKIGNSGSFFKNPVVDADFAEKLKREHTDMPMYAAEDGKVKLAAGWLIEQCGWKGKVVGATGAHKQQALVLVNYGGATGSEIWQLAINIQQSVKEKFGVQLQPEVNVY
ncbi:UDP-N-acetylmuramate dehydrogenase [bacterium]|nr:UDP-N-acetylmuramate dehydrogenase [bacterium]